MRLLEREKATTAVEAVVSACQAGQGQVLVVEAPAGLGKTSLLEYAEKSAAQAGVTTRWGGGDLLEQDLPWSTASQLFSTDTGIIRALAEATEESPGSPLGLLIRIGRALTAQAEHEPVLLLIDDAHWADSQSLLMIHWLGRRIRSKAIGIIVTSRPTDAAADLITKLIGDTLAQHIRLAPLRDEAMEALIRDIAPQAPDDAIREAVDAVGGNPMLGQGIAHELTAPHRDLKSGLPPVTDRTHLAVWVQSRIHQSHPDAGVIASAAAVLGKRADLHTIASVTQLATDRVAAAVDALIRDGFVISEPIGFSHPIGREIVYESLGPAQRRSLHYRCAQTVNDSREAAAHLHKAGPRGEDWELPVLQSAAHIHFANGAPRQAAALLRLALDSTVPSPHLLIALGRAELASGQPNAAARFREATAMHDQPSLALDAQIGEWLYSAGQFDDAAAAFGRGLDRLGDNGDPMLRAELIAGLHTAGLLAGRHPERTKVAVETAAQTTAGHVSPADLILATTAVGEAALGLDRPVAEVKRLVDTVLSNSSAESLGRPLLEPLAGALQYCDDFARAGALLDELVESAIERGELVACISLQALRAYGSLRMGQLTNAERDAQEVLSLADTHSSASAHALAPAYFVLASVELLRGDIARANKTVDVDIEETWGSALMGGWVLDARGQVLLAQNQGEAAHDTFVTAGERFTAAGGAGGWSHWRGGAALAARAVGDHDAANRFADDFFTTASTYGPPTRIAAALRTQAAVSGRPEVRQELLEAALSCLDGTEAVLDWAETAIQAGSARRRLGQRREARDLIRRGRQIAAKCGAHRLVSSADDELRASGARRPARALSGLDALTDRERRVAEHAAGGLNNRAIAETLFISVKTVESQLGSVYRKLGIEGRDALPAVLSSATD
ncbi:AAA family ATPase [Mycolicibacterium hippocampi]|uniref:ATP-binding protein n=1 Tax=Mycolicibacterium hippocampi TaxID=659824 RepID=UPI003515B001